MTTVPVQGLASTASQQPTDAYMFNNANPEAARQVRLLAEILDAHTTEVLSVAGVGDGWKCLDLGAGAGTITHWLAEQVGPSGHVTALDLDPRHIPAPTPPNVDIIQGDVRSIDLPDTDYDLIHTRLLLMHLPTRGAVLRRLGQAVRPGGLVVVSDWDCEWRTMLLHSPVTAAVEAFDAFQTALLDIAVDNGADLAWARRTPLAMRDAGLVDVDTVLFNRLWAGGEAGCLLHASNSIQRETLLRERGVTPAQLATLREAMNDPGTLAYSYLMFSTVARRPEQ